MMRPWELVLLATLYPPAFAGEADVLNVDVSCNSSLVCRFDVTVRHDEQPFTRSLTNVIIPDDLSEVIVRAHDLKHEYGGKEIVVELPN